MPPMKADVNISCPLQREGEGERESQGERERGRERGRFNDGMEENDGGVLSGGSAVNFRTQVVRWLQQLLPELERAFVIVRLTVLLV